MGESESAEEQEAGKGTALSTTPPDPLLIAAYHLAYDRHAARHLHVDDATLSSWVSSPIVLDALAKIEAKVRKRIVDHADADAVSIMRAEAPAMARKLVAIAKSGQERNAVVAAKESLALAGVTPPKATHQATPENLIDAMTPDELERFLSSNGTEWPSRFGDHLRRLALRRQFVATGALTVDAEVVDEEEEEASMGIGHGSKSQE